jgi:putative oxygen-independent coproporphyrinogen III oxidase
MNNRGLLVYIHWPYCLSKCNYCAFNKYVGPPDPRMRDGFSNEIKYYYDLIGKRKIKTIYFGGGTPSLAPISTVKEILENIGKYFDIEKQVEITMEMNPSTLEISKLKSYKDIGVNRISLGVQALNDNDLNFLGRKHTAREAIIAIAEVSKIFERSSFDLIFGRPNQSLNEWGKELKESLRLATSHMSLYQLTFERGTPLYKMRENGEIRLKEDDEIADMYELTKSYCESYGFHRYEISNYGKIRENSGGEVDFSLHNMSYWRGEDYIGLGPGAHGRFLVDSLQRYYRTVGNPVPKFWIQGVRSLKEISKKEVLQEYLMMALRTTEGISEDILINRFDVRGFDSLYISDEIKSLIERHENRLTCNDKGIMVLDSVLPFIKLV